MWRAWRRPSVWRSNGALWAKLSAHTYIDPRQEKLDRWPGKLKQQENSTYSKSGPTFHRWAEYKTHTHFAAVTLTTWWFKDLTGLRCFTHLRRLLPPFCGFSTIFWGVLLAVKRRKTKTSRSNEFHSLPSSSPVDFKTTTRTPQKRRWGAGGVLANQQRQTPQSFPTRA